MNKEQFEELYKLAQKAMSEISTTYKCSTCGMKASLTSNGVEKQCACDGSVIAEMQANMEISADLKV